MTVSCVDLIATIFPRSDRVKTKVAQVLDPSCLHTRGGESIFISRSFFYWLVSYCTLSTSCVPSKWLQRREQTSCRQIATLNVYCTLLFSIPSLPLVKSVSWRKSRRYCAYHRHTFLKKMSSYHHCGILLVFTF